MSMIDYSLEPRSDIAFIDMKSFYASVECVKRHLHPLQTSLCVMSHSDNSNGLILASSPMFKHVFGNQNVRRSCDLLFDIHTRKFRYAYAKKQGISITQSYVRYIETWARNTLIVPPRMGIYIQENLKIQKILHTYAAPEDIHPYSIDEGFIDLTHSLNYFIRSKELSRKKKLDYLSSLIQQEIWKQTGIFSTIGMSNANPLLAKLALDNEAKKSVSMRANWSYEEVPTKVWQMKSLTDFWGIGERTKRRLNRLSIYSIKDLAHANPDILKKEFGIMGVQLWFHANGIDESKPSKPYRPKSRGLGNSQVLPRDYISRYEIELVLREIAEQVAIRLRRIHKKASVVSIYVGFSYKEQKRSIHAQKKISPTQSTHLLTQAVMQLFHEHYTGGAVRNIGVRYDQFVNEQYANYSLFDDVDALQKKETLEKTMDTIREQFGFLSIQKGSSLMKGSRVIERSNLIGGHCGGLDGM